MPALALINGRYVLRVILSLEGLTWQLLDRAIADVAAQAARDRPRPRPP